MPEDIKPLSFELPIVELEKKLVELKEALKDDNAPEIIAIQQQISLLKEKIYSNLTPWQIVEISRHPQRPTAIDYINYLIEGFIELHGDRYFGDDKSIITGVGKLRGVENIKGMEVVVVAQEKGKTVEEKMYRNFGMPNPEGYRKALRVMRLAEKHKLPILTLVDTPGAFPGIGAEERGQAEAIAKNLAEMSILKTPIVVVVIGEGGSGGALGIAVGDRILMLQYATYSVISPEGCASILWRDASYAPQAAEALKLTAKDLKELGVIDEIVPEPLGGAHKNPSYVFNYLQKRLLEIFLDLKKMSPEKLVQKRYEKFRKMGAYKII